MQRHAIPVRIANVKRIELMARMHTKLEVLALCPEAVCRQEREPGKIAFYIVRHGNKLLGRHRVAATAWDSAWRSLRHRQETAERALARKART